MSFFMVFSLMLVLAASFHSLGLVLGALLFVISLGLWRAWGIRKTVRTLGAGLRGILAVWIYDWRTQAESTQILTNQYQVIEQQTSNRYVVSNQGVSLLFYSRAALQAGDRFETQRRPQSRDFMPQWCWSRCVSHTRQSRQVIDSGQFDYDARLYMQGMVGSLYDDHPFVLGTTHSTRASIREQIRQTLISALPSSSTQALGLGMLLGDRSLFDQEQYTHFITSGLVHIVAVSGTHLAIILALASLILQGIPYRLRLPFLIGTIICYAYLVGWHASVLRSTIMTVFTLMALLPGRQISIWRLLGYARVLMLTGNPYFILYDMGFLLSFGALLGILWTDKILVSRLMPYFLPHLDYSGQERQVIDIDINSVVLQRIYRDQVWKEWMSTKRPRGKSSWRKQQALHILRLLILPSIGATIGIFPVLIYFTGEINIFNPLANFVVIPLVPAIMAGLIVLTTTHRARVGTLLQYALDYINTIADILSQFALHFEVSSVGSILILCCMICYYGLWIKTELRHETQTAWLARPTADPDSILADLS